jgi:hypothetical protein
MIKVAVAATWGSNYITQNAFHQEGCACLSALYHTHNVFKSVNHSVEKLFLVTGHEREWKNHMGSNVKVINVLERWNEMRELYNMIEGFSGHKNVFNAHGVPKITSFFLTEYDVVVFVDCDNYPSPPLNYPATKFIKKMAMHNPDYWARYHMGGHAPVNAGYLVVKPHIKFFKSLQRAIRHGFDTKHGWGGNYSAGSVMLAHEISKEAVVNNDPEDTRLVDARVESACTWMS